MTVRREVLTMEPELIEFNDCMAFCNHDPGSAVCQLCGKPCEQSWFEYLESRIQRRADSIKAGT
jgi:hypothetical protein